MNKAALITGASQRVGLATAKHLIDRGYSVIGTYRARRLGVEALESLGATMFKVDFNSPSEINALIKTIKEHTKQIDVIIHNASDWLPETSDLLADELFDRMFSVHTKAPYLINKGLADILSDSSHIIHISDAKTVKGSDKHIAYVASKAALESLTLSFASALAPRTKVNTIAPAIIMFNDNDSEQYKQKTLDKALIKKEGGIDEFLASVDYLLNTQFVTGRTLYIDGGRHLK